MSIKTCPKCSKNHEKRGIFCSRSCANSRGPRTAEFKLHVSNKLAGRKILNPKKRVNRIETKCCGCQILLYVVPNEYRKYKTCGKIECRKVASSIAGRNSAAKQIKRSKDEIKLYDLCVAYFKNVKHNQIIANGWDADIVIEDLKVAIMWNGPWHYIEMKHKNHSLIQVQTRDFIKIKLFESLGWKVYVFEDRYYTPETAFLHLKMIGVPGEI